MDYEFIKSMQQVVNAYQIVSDQTAREEYLKMIRLRCFASQYMN